MEVRPKILRVAAQDRLCRLRRDVSARFAKTADGILNAKISEGKMVRLAAMTAVLCALKNTILFAGRMDGLILINAMQEKEEFKSNVKVRAEI